MTEPSEKRVPPYISFATLLSQIERMEKETVPTEIDKHFLVGMAGGTQNHFRHALRSLGLIDENSRSTDLLRALAGQPGGRKELFARILHARFPELTELPIDASKSEYERVLDNYGANSSETKRKALTFYVAAAEFSGIPVSNHVKVRRAAAGTRRAPTRRAKSATGNGGGTGETPPQAPASDMRRAYFDLLVDKAKSDNADSDLLDRIERLLGVPAADTSPASPTGEPTTTGGGAS